MRTEKVQIETHYPETLAAVTFEATMFGHGFPSNHNQSIASGGTWAPHTCWWTACLVFLASLHILKVAAQMLVSPASVDWQSPCRAGLRVCPHAASLLDHLAANKWCDWRGVDISMGLTIALKHVSWFSLAFVPLGRMPRNPWAALIRNNPLRLYSIFGTCACMRVIFCYKVYKE